MKPTSLPLNGLLAFAFGALAGLSASLMAQDRGDALSLPDEVRFNRDVRTIFSKICFACHGPDANAREAKLRLDVRAEAIADRKGDRPIVPGDADASLAYQLITDSDPDYQMPPADFHTQLTPREKAMIARWIDQGAEYETHWAFIPPERLSAISSSRI